MTFIKVLERNEGLAALHVYQDQPSDTPYPFRAKTYVLKPTDRFHALAKEWKR